MQPPLSGVAAQGASRIITDLAGIRATERVLLVDDDTSHGSALASIADALALADAVVHRIDAASFLQAPTLEADVVVSLASPLLTHSDEMRRRLASGARYINLRGIDPDLLGEAAMTDFDALHALTKSLAERMSAARDVRVLGESGTEVRMRLTGGGLALSGVARGPGEIGGFPGGEVAVVPASGSVDGVIRDPDYVEGLRESAAGLAIQIAQDVVELDGASPASHHLDSHLTQSDAGRSIGEFGLGTNSRLTPQSPRTAKKKLGMAHFGIGDNRTFGGHLAADSHIDVILATPTVLVDGEPLIDHGLFTWSP